MVKTQGARARLRDMILNEEYREGTYMPSVRELAERLNVSKSSVHNILKLLQEENLIRLCPGRGAIVCSRTPDFPRLSRFFLRPSDFGIYNYLPIASRLLEGICAGAEKRNTEFTISFSDSESMTEALIAAYSRNEIQGVIYLQCADRDGLIAPLEKAGIPYAIAHDMHGFPAVKAGVDFRDVAKRAVRYLMERGHRRLALLAGEPDAFLYAEMIDQFRRLSAEEGFETRGEWILTDVITGKNNDLSTIFRKGDLPDAVFTIRDYRARILFEAAAERGISIPRDLSVISFDNTTWDEAALAHLTTFEEPLHALGEHAVQMLQHWVETGEKPESISLHAPLVERGSVKSLV